MEKDKREFIITQLMVPGFAEHKKQEMVLEETEETGRSELRVRLESAENLCIANIDAFWIELWGTHSIYTYTD